MSQTTIEILGDIQKRAGEESDDPGPEPPSATFHEAAQASTWNPSQYAILGVSFMLVFPIYLVYEATAWFFCLNVSGVPAQFLQSRMNQNSKFYRKVHELQQTSMRFVWLSKIISRRLVILSLTWLILTLSIPGLKERVLLGSELWKWTLLVTIVSCGYNIISLTIRFFLYLMFLNKQLKRNKLAEYYARGLRKSVNLVVHVGAILLTWIFYFKTDHGIIKKKDNGDNDEVILDIGTWTFVALMTAAWLWLLKNFLLLKWEADAVYRRFRERILNTGSQLYFVGHICDMRLHIFQPKSHAEEKATTHVVHGSRVADDHQDFPQEDAQHASINTDAGNNLEEAMEMSDEEKNKERAHNEKKAKTILCNDTDATTHHIKQMANYFIYISKVSSREDDGTSDVLEQCRRIKPKYTRCITKEDLKKFKLKEKDADILYRKHLKEHGSDQVSYEHFEKWMVKAQKNCVALGRTLSDAGGVVKVLDKVLTTILIAIAIIAWLLLTDIASTKILILIASPLLATVFVFGDTCKKIFEGIIFSFINHPFDVGDRCIIENTELEVKRMSVLGTTFIRIGTKDEALYPNSTLATMAIINLKGEPDPNDNVELILDSNYTKSMLEKLQEKITRSFEDDKGIKYEKEASVVIKEIGESCIKMAIQFQHVMNIHEMTHSQCLEQKRKHTSELLLQIKQFTDDINMKNIAS